MQVLIRLAVFAFFLAVIPVCAQKADQVPLTLDAAGATGATVATVAGGETEVSFTSTSAMVPAQMTGTLEPGSMRVLAFSYFAAHATEQVQMEYECADGKRHIAAATGLSHSEGFTEYVSDVGSATDWVHATRILGIGFKSAPGRVIRVRGVVVRAYTQQEISAAQNREQRGREDETLRGDLVRYLGASYSGSIEDISATPDTLMIRGRLTQAEDVLLGEIPPHQTLLQVKHFELVTPVPLVSGVFSMQISRYRKSADHSYDRVLSKWVLLRRDAAGDVILSHAHYVDSVTAKWDLPEDVPRSKKGLGGFTSAGPKEDLEELGIASVTVNLVLNFLRASTGPDRIDFSYGGQQYHADAGEIASYDATMQHAAERHIIVAAILLVPKRSAPQEGPEAVNLANPNADFAGIYVMPNFSTAAGVQVYAAMLNFLAERYSRPDKQFGRVHHWIMHNEVDAGWVWTNAGELSELTYVDLYIKSMRTMFVIARQYNPHARVYISLTHFWNHTEDRHFYLPHKMLDDLVAFSRAEGDFDWSIAYHPYPTSLFNPRTWEDTMVTFDLNTPLITFANIEVLDAWTRQPTTFYRGKTARKIFLSEQGFNARNYSVQALRDQAAGMAYAWKKIEHLDSIEGLQYHAWIDNRAEGGLRIGLRKFRDEPGDPLGKKPIWYLYQKLDTPEEDKISEPYKKIIGISDWRSILHTGAIAGLPLL